MLGLCVNRLNHRKMGTTEEWLEGRIKAYDKNPTETLRDMLYTTTCAINIFLNEPTSKFAKGALSACMKRNRVFLERLSSCELSETESKG